MTSSPPREASSAGPRAMQLRELLSAEARCDADKAATIIRGIASDSRKVEPGALFAALAGSRADGASFIAAAVEAGAAAVLAERKPDGLPEHVAFVQSANPRRELALAAAKFFSHQPTTIAAVTGTSGKTSVAAFVRQIWDAIGHRAASLGTVGLVAPGREVYGSLTTPDPIELHRTLQELAEDDITHLVVEASSHGLDQHRLDGVRINIAAFTNLSRDHLDYHPSDEAYLAAKLRLFTEVVDASGSAVVMVDHPAGEQVAAATRARRLQLLTIGRAGETIRLDDVRIEGYGQAVDATFAGSRVRFHLPLVGAFQVENALVAAGIAIASGSDPHAVATALSELKGAKGRLELVGARAGAPIFIDYAHKPDALEKTLDALRPYVKSRLIVVFGAGGDRDRGKRPIMGAIAADKADVVIVTDDNPRSEEPAAIRREILAAAPGAEEIGDRGEAIGSAIRRLQAGDVLVIAGKGHESGQIVGDRVLPFSDHGAVADALGELAA